MLRLRRPDADITFTDLVRGEITFPAGSVPAPVLVRASGAPLYTLTNPVDDALMRITHVLRGEGNRKLSKRDPEMTLFLYRERGFLPEGLLNYLALLGWAIAEDRDVFTMAEPPSGAQLATLRAITPLIQERLIVLSDAPGMVGFLFVSEDEFSPEPESVAKALGPAAEPVVNASIAALEGVAAWSAPAIEDALKAALSTASGSSHGRRTPRCGSRSPAAPSRRRCTSRGNCSAATGRRPGCAARNTAPPGSDYPSLGACPVSSGHPDLDRIRTSTIP